MSQVGWVATAVFSAHLLYHNQNENDDLRIDFVTSSASTYLSRIQSREFKYPVKL